MIDLATAEGALAFLRDQHLPAVASTLRETRKLRPFAVIFARKDPDTKVPSEVFPYVVAVADASSKDEWVNTVKVLMKATDACGIIFSTEAWMMRAPDQAFVDNYQEGDISKRDDKIEIVTVLMEHIAIPEVRTWNARINRNMGRPKLEAFEESNASFGGRFIFMDHHRSS